MTGTDRHGAERRAGGDSSGSATSSPVGSSTAEPYWDAVAAHWDEQRPQRLWRRHSDAVNERLIDAWLPPAEHGRLLKTDAFDEAVSGGLAVSLRARCAQLIVSDLALRILRDAQRNVGNDVVVAGDARALPYASASFDTIVSLSTLDHFRSEAELIASLVELRRVSVAGARMVLTLDNPANPVVALRGALPFAWLQRLGLVPYFVGANFAPARLVSALEEVGFEVEEATALVHAPRVLAIALGRLLDRWAQTRLGAWWLRALMCFEVLGRLPTRNFSGHFLAVRVRAR